MEREEKKEQKVKVKKELRI